MNRLIACWTSWASAGPAADVRLNQEYLPATQAAELELVLLHGWGSSREIWRPLLASVRGWANVTLFNVPGCAPGSGAGERIELPDVLAAVFAVAPERAVYLGWSLGGKLALELAAHSPQRVAAVVTVCSNPRFVAEAGWPGMEADAFCRFQASCVADPSAALRRFDSLQVTGAKRPRQKLRQLQSRRPPPEGGELLTGLHWLAQLDQRELVGNLNQPQLHLLAEHDALVPVALEPALATLLPASAQARVVLLRDASHVAPLESAPSLADRTRRFLADAGLLHAGATPDAGPAKREVASSFSRAAQSYDSVATLQRDVGCKLLEVLDGGSRVEPAVVLDLGCGTGFFQPMLRSRYPGATLIGLDLAQGMIEHARAHTDDHSKWLVGDAELLPLASESVDLIFSSLAIQWCHRPELLFAELARVLKPGGRCVFTTLGPGTLDELRQAWAAVDTYQHVNTFLPACALEAAAALTPGISLTLKEQRHCMQYARVGELLSELKALGAHNMNKHRPAGLTSRKTLLGMLQAYEARRLNGLLPASYEVIFGEVSKL